MQETLTLDERLANYIVEGTKQGLQEDLSLALEEGRKPLDIINGPLMTGMDEEDDYLIIMNLLLLKYCKVPKV